jgi:hypothetical protein
MTLLGCEKSLDSPEYGELIHSVPTDLNRPYPLPELDPPTANPLPGPASQGSASGAQSAESAAQPGAESTSGTPPTDESSPKAAENPE